MVYNKSKSDKKIKIKYNKNHKMYIWESFTQKTRHYSHVTTSRPYSKPLLSYKPEQQSLSKCQPIEIRQISIHPFAHFHSTETKSSTGVWKPFPIQAKSPWRDNCWQLQKGPWLSNRPPPYPNGTGAEMQ